MSHYSNINLVIKDAACLLEALIDMGWRLDQIEVHETSSNLYGFEGDQRKDLAHIIIRRQFVGHASNDIGFLKQDDGTYTAIISDYDRDTLYGECWVNRLKQTYGVRVAERQAKLKGMSVKKTIKQDGSVQLVMTKKT